MKTFIEDPRTGETLKRCSKCRVYKKLSEYHRKEGNPRNIAARCKICLSRKRYKNRNDRFWKSFYARTRLVDGCLEWAGAYSNGHPVCRYEGRGHVMIRRIVYKLAIGELADDMFVTTTCRNNRCVKQSHLKNATKEEIEIIRCNSMAIGERNGSHTHPEKWHRGDEHWSRLHPELRTYGERHGCAKLSDNEVRQIRALAAEGLSRTGIAQQFSTHRSTVSRVIEGKTWTHVD